jgi:hypothetical protein
MPLVTNRCPKHKNAFPETECPFCVLEAKESAIGASRAFFENYGGHKVILQFRDRREEVAVEKLYQHFRARLLEELAPTLMKVEREG